MTAPPGPPTSTDDSHAAPRAPRAGRRPLRPARAADAGRPPGRVRGLLRCAPARSTSPTTRLRAHRARSWTRSPWARRPRPSALTAARARHARAASRGDAGRRRPGRFPAGTPYAADDPALLLWILASARRLGACSSTSATSRRLDARRARGATGSDYQVVGRLFGLRRRRHARRPGRDFRRLHGRHARLAATSCVTPTARASSAIHIVMHPPVPLHFRPLLELANFDHRRAAARRDVRRQYGFSLGPGRARWPSAAAPSTLKRVRRAAAARARALRAQRARRAA